MYNFRTSLYITLGFIFFIIVCKFFFAPKSLNKEFINIPLNSPERITHLFLLAQALEEYKNNTKHYPISSNNGKDLDLYINDKGEINESWITGLVPDYIKKLPRDPRKSPDPHMQYIYKSDGANYLLLSRYPGEQDCNWAKIHAIEMIYENCKAIGFWPK